MKRTIIDKLGEVNEESDYDSTESDNSYEDEDNNIEDDEGSSDTGNKKSK